MAIQHRRGDYSDYRPNKMLSGELAATLQHDPKAVDGKALHVAFAPGIEKTLMMFEDAEAMIEDATAIALDNAIERATGEAEAWAHGDGFTTNDIFSGDGVTRSFTLEYEPEEIIYARVNDLPVISYRISGREFIFTNAPASGTANINIEYTVSATNDNAKYYKEQAVGSATSASNSATSASGSATTATNQRKESEAWAVGTKDGTSVASGDTQYHNNSKYYAEQASGSATSASGSATTANNQRKEAEAWAVGTKDGEAVPSTDVQYHNNAKYNAERAEAAAESVENIIHFDQQSAFTVEQEDDEYVLYWFGTIGECPYTLQTENGEYVLYYTYETTTLEP